MKDFVPPPGTTIIRDKEGARRAIEELYRFKNRIHAWDTETHGFDVKVESPIGHGKVLCATCFVGPDADFGNGPRLLVDNFADSEGILLEFKSYFEDASVLKCWHNYGFDRHVIFNHGINVQGFGGDTMHMARLADPSRFQYSLKALTQDLNGDLSKQKQNVSDYLWKQLEEESKLLKQ